MRNTRAALLDAAERLIRERGYAGVSYADLAELVGVRKASIHHHFPGKADLALALLDAYGARYETAMDNILATYGDALGRIRAYAVLYRQGVETGLGCLCSAYAAELATLPAPLRDGLANFFGRHVAWLERVLVQGQLDGDIRGTVAPAATARMILAALEGALMMERVLGGGAGFAATLAGIEAAIVAA